MWAIVILMYIIGEIDIKTTLKKRKHREIVPVVSLWSIALLLLTIYALFPYMPYILNDTI